MGTFLSFFAFFAVFLFPNAETLHAHPLADHLQAILPPGLAGLVMCLRNWTYTLFYVAAELWVRPNPPIKGPEMLASERDELLACLRAAAFAARAHFCAVRAGGGSHKGSRGAPPADVTNVPTV